MPKVAGPVPGAQSLWYQNFYKIRKKVVAIANQYWIEDGRGTQLGYSRQKIIRIKEDIRIFSDDSMSQEVFRIKQENIADAWGTFDVIDSATEAIVGKLRRKALKSGLFADEYFLLDSMNNQIGRVSERAGRATMRRWMPGGGLVPEQVVVEFNGREVAEIKQQFKIIGDSWEVDCSGVPANFDRRTLLACMLMMGMVERDRK
jgi:uncharacterized protein YxjI